MKRSLLASLVLIIVLPAQLASLPGQVPPQAGQLQKRPIESDDATKMRLAASQYAIIEVLLDEGRIQEIPGEFQKILDLGLTGDRARAVGKAAWQIADRLRTEQHFAQAHAVVNMTLAEVDEVETVFSLLMLRAKILQSQRLYPQAIQALREAQQLQRAQPPGR